MTVTVLNNQNTFYADGSNTVFDFNFSAVSANDLQVVLTNSLGAQTTLSPASYLIALNPAAPGSLWSVGGVLSYPLSGPPLASGNSLTITRIIPLQQTTEISNQGDFYPTVVEQALDILLMQIQQINARTGQLRGTWLTNTLYNFGDIVTDGANGANTGNLYVCAIANTSGVWATDKANGYWSLELNVQSIVNSLPQIANNQVFGNISGTTNTPTGIGVSALLDSVFGGTQGGVLYRGGSLWTLLIPGANGQVLTSQGASANPQWTSIAGSGSVTNVGTNAGLTGGPITSTGTIGLATVANNSLLANVSGGTAAPSATTLSSLLDSVLGNTQGAIIYRGGTTWNELAPGTNGQVLTTQGAAANPHWASSGGAGTLTAGSLLTINPFSHTNTSATHGLGSIPAIFDIRLVCLNADQGYSIGDSVVLGGPNVNGANAAFSVAADSTFVYFSGAAAPSITNKSSAGSGPINESNWKLVITPYKVN